MCVNCYYPAECGLTSVAKDRDQWRAVMNTAVKCSCVNQGYTKFLKI